MAGRESNVSRVERPRSPAAVTTDSSSAAVLILEPSTGLVRLNLRDVWAYRELLYFLVWRDVKVRYKQTVLGAAWAILQPVMTMVVFSIFFGRFAKMPSDGVPYPVFAFAALLPWQLFAYALSESANSLVGSQNLITKVYFPRLIVPLASVLAGLVDFAIAFVVLLGLMWHYGIVPTAPSSCCRCSSRSRWRPRWRSACGCRA